MSPDRHQFDGGSTSKSSLHRRYTNNNRDTYGRSTYEYGITCRNILTDPENHAQLKQNHAKNPNFRK